MGCGQDTEKTGGDEHAYRQTKAQRPGRACSVLVAIALALSVSLSVAALTVVLQEREHHHHQHHDQPSSESNLQAKSGETAPLSADGNSWSPQLKQGINKRQVQSEDAYSCNVTHWRELCDVPAIRYPHHTIGARVTMTGNTKYRDEEGFLIWEYRPDDCVAMCMGMQHPDNTSMVISRHGIYNIRVELRSNEHFTPMLGIRLHVNGKRVHTKWYPNTPLANSEGNIEHMLLKVDKDTQTPGVRSRHQQTAQAAGLSILQKKSLEVPIVLERMMYLDEGSMISVKAHGAIPRTRTHRKALRDLTLGHDDVHNNYLQVFRL